MSKFKVGDRVITEYGDDMIIDHVTPKNLSTREKPCFRDEVYICRLYSNKELTSSWYRDNELKLYQEPMIPMHEIESLSEELESYYTQTGFSMDYWEGYHAQRKKINYKLKEILNKYKDSE